MQKGTPPKGFKIEKKSDLELAKEKVRTAKVIAENAFMEEYQNEHNALVTRLCKKYNGTITPTQGMSFKIND